MLSSNPIPGHHFRPGTFPSAGLLNRLYNMVLGMKGRNGTVVLLRESGIEVFGGSASTVTKSWAYTPSSGDRVLIGDGHIIRGDDEPLVIDQTEVQITGGTVASPHYVVLEYNYISRTGLIHATASAIKPSGEVNIFRCILHEFAYSSGAITHVKQRQSSDIIIPGFA